MGRTTLSDDLAALVTTSGSPWGTCGTSGVNAARAAFAPPEVAEALVTEQIPPGYAGA